MAARCLRKKGYKLLYHNFRPRRGGEIDLVCRHGQTLVFVEVKTRAGMAFGRPSEAVDHAKQQRLMEGAAAWLRLLDRPEVVYRFDIVEVIFGPGDGTPECTVIPNAFLAPETGR